MTLRFDSRPHILKQKETFYVAPNQSTELIMDDWWFKLEAVFLLEV